MHRILRVFSRTSRQCRTALNEFELWSSELSSVGKEKIISEEASLQFFSANAAEVYCTIIYPLLSPGFGSKHEGNLLLKDEDNNLNYLRSDMAPISETAVLS